MDEWSECRIRKMELPITTQQPFLIGLNNPDGVQKGFLGDVHFAFQICIVLEGIFEVLYPSSDNYSRKLHPGQFFITSAWEPHALRELTHPGKMLALSFSIENVALSGIEDSDINWLLAFSLPPKDRNYGDESASSAKIISYAKEINTLNQEKPFAYKTKIWLKILGLLVEIAEISPKNPNSPKSENFNRIMPAILIIQKAGPEYPSLHECATHCNLSRSRFSHIFSLSMGISFGKFLLRAKMSKAEKLITQSELSFKEISFQCGFKSITSFYHAFYKYFKTTPMEMRKSKSLK